jgi:hypothetical protein
VRQPEDTSQNIVLGLLEAGRAEWLSKRQAATSGGVCVVAMLTDRTKEEILVEVGSPERPDYFLLNYMQSLGLVVEDVRDDSGFDRTLAWSTMFNGYLNLALGIRYYCSVRTAKAVHAVAVDEFGRVFDPSTSALMLGTCTAQRISSLEPENV